MLNTLYGVQETHLKYCKVPKFSDARKLCCNLPKIQTKSPKPYGISKDANGIANSEDPDQTAPLAHRIGGNRECRF